jgi:5-methylthioadenosine/S-adenosylhomocysteine deaminase
MDLAITDALVVTLDERRGGIGLLDDGAVGVTDGEIEFVGPTAELDASGASREIDADGGVVLPGLVDAHVHTPLTLLRGGAQDLPEIEWMNRGLGPFVRHMDGRDRVVGSRLGVVEAIRSGVTTFGEYASEVERLVEEVHGPIGTRVAATETINEVDDEVRGTAGPREPYPFDPDRGEAALERADALSDRYADRSLVTPMYGPQALDMVSPGLLDRIRDRARERDASIHMHVAQGEREHLQVRSRYGPDASTVGVLDDRGLLNDRLIAVHCHGATAEERARMVDRGVRTVCCPSSIAAIDGVVPPIAELLDRGAIVGLGTDQAPGPGGHDLLRELGSASLLSKVDRGDPTRLPAWEALRLGTLGGARALGLADRVGTIAVGKRADLAVIPLDTASTAPTVSTPFHTAIPNLVYGGTRAETVLVEGQPVLHEGEFTTINERAVLEEAIERARELFERASEDWREAGSKLVSDADAGRL